jgi:hypothetical protein
MASLSPHSNVATTLMQLPSRHLPHLHPQLFRPVGSQGREGDDNNDTTISLKIGLERTVVGAAAKTTTTVGMALPLMIDCGVTSADDGSDCGGSWDCSKARTTDVDNNPRGGGRQPQLRRQEGGCRQKTTTMTMSKRTLALAPTPAATAATTAIVHCPSPNKQRIAGPSRELRRKSLDDSVEGEDRRRRCNDGGRTRRR